MKLKKVFQALMGELGQLEKPLDELIKLTGDYGPQKGAVHLIPKLYDHMVELDALRVETTEAAMQALKTIDHPVDLEATREALTACQKAFNALVKTFWQNVMSFEQIQDLVALGRDRGNAGEQWLKWTSTFQSWVTDLLDCFPGVNETLSLSWQELTDRLARNSVSVQATTIGQQITVPEEKETREGIT
jgi:hypothetical protein